MNRFEEPLTIWDIDFILQVPLLRVTSENTKIYFISFISKIYNG